MNSVKLFLIILFSFFYTINFSQIKINVSPNSNFKNEHFQEVLKFNTLFKDSTTLTDSVKNRIQLFTSQQGFFFPEIKFQSLSTDSNQIIYKSTFTLNEGKPTIVNSINVPNLESNDSLFVNEYLSQSLNSTFLPSNLQTKLFEIVEHYENIGFPFAKFTIQNIKFKESDKFYDASIYIEFDKGEIIKINKIVIDGNEKTKDYFIKNIINISEGNTFSQEQIDLIIPRLTKLNFFSKIKKPTLLFNSKNDASIFISVKEKSTNYFDGIIGYVPKQNDLAGYFTGVVDVSLQNLFGTGRGLGFAWKKLDRNSQLLNIEYLEPWIFSLPININFSLMQRTQDTTYVQRQVGGEINYLANDYLKAGLLYSFEETIPNEDTTKFTVYNSTYFTSGLHFLFDVRDDLLILKNGFLANLILKYSRKNISGPSNFINNLENKKTNQYRIELDFIAAKNFWQQNILFFSAGGRYLNTKNIDAGDLYRLGGTNTIRGYREDQFMGNKVAWTNLEYRFLLSSDSFAFLFYDSGYFFNETLKNDFSNTYQSTIYGYGGGISFMTTFGLMKVSYALGKTDSFSEGKIHFGLINKF